jgi:hypothetical protein
MAPHAPLTFGAPRRSRGAPLRGEAGGAARRFLGGLERDGLLRRAKRHRAQRDDADQPVLVVEHGQTADLRLWRVS